MNFSQNFPVLAVHFIEPVISSKHFTNNVGFFFLSLRSTSFFLKHPFSPLDSGNGRFVAATTMDSSTGFFCGIQPTLPQTYFFSPQRNGLKKKRRPVKLHQPQSNPLTTAPLPNYAHSRTVKPPPFPNVGGGRGGVPLPPYIPKINFKKYPVSNNFHFHSIKF